MALRKLKEWSQLEMMANYVGVEIDPEKPRESRVAVALECDKKGNIPEAIEAMTGVPLHEFDKGMLFDYVMMRQVASDPKEFYEGFPEVDS